MTQRDREAVVKNYMKHTKEQAEKSKTAIQAMQEALAVSENDRRKLSESARASSNRLQESLAKQQQLEQENKKLSAEVATLTEELKTSREKSNKLLEQIREDNQKEWLKREAMFKNAIRKLQKQLKAVQQNSKQGEGKEGIETVKETTTQPKLIKVAPSFQVGRTTIRPVVQQPHPAFRRTKIPEPKTKSSEKQKNERQHRSSMVVFGSENDENCSQHAHFTNSSTSTMEGILKPKRMFGQTGELKSIMKKPTQQEMAKSFAGPATSGRAAHPSDAFKGGKTPSKNRAQFVRGNGGVKGLQDKLRLVRSPTFK
jgi:archaellum component FlaC